MPMLCDRGGDSCPMGRRPDASPMLVEAEMLRGELAAARRRIARLVAIRRRDRRTIRHLAAMATTDVLTELPNRRHFEAALGERFALSARLGTPLSVLMIDVDGFKRFNDAYGHAAGDEVLRIVARRLLAFAGDGDVVARYGGEEFAIVMPDADAAAACERADRQRAAIESFGWPLLPVTASFGVATRTPETPDFCAMVREADRALYISKRAGRNRVTHLGLASGVRTAEADRPVPPADIAHEIAGIHRPSPHRPWLCRPGRRGAMIGDERSTPGPR